VHADTDEGALVLSVGHVLQRFTNDYFISPRPRSAVGRSADNAVRSGRYSVVFSVAPAPSHVVTTFPQFITWDRPARYGPVLWEDYQLAAGRKMYAR